MRSLQNDATAQDATASLLTKFAQALVTVSLEEMRDSNDLEYTHSYLLIQYCDVKDSSLLGGRSRTKKMAKATKPLMRVCAVGPETASSIIKKYALLTSPLVSEENRPDVDLQCIFKRENERYCETMKQVVSSIKSKRNLPARKSRTSDEIQQEIDQGEFNVVKLSR